MTSPAPLAGQIIRASMFTRPYRAWGQLDEDFGTGTAFAALTQTQFTTPNFEIFDDRVYRLSFTELWRCTAVDNTIEWAIQADPGTGVFANLSLIRETNASVLGSSSECDMAGANWTPAVNAANARMRVLSNRIAGAGTITPSTYRWWLEDVGPA